jgi:hypothetical protein
VIPLSRRFLVLLVLVFFYSAAFVQDTAVPTVTFTLDFPNSDPEHFVLSVLADGHAIYDSNGKLTSLSEDKDPFHLEFIISAKSREHMFELVKRAHYFDGELESKLPNLAFTGKKTVAYTDRQKNVQVSYVNSVVPAVQEFTAFCQHLSETLEFGRRLEFYRRYQKLALDDELKRMEEMAKDNQLSELPAVAPILQSIAKDTSVMNMVRGRALRLLDKAGVRNSFR